MLGDWGIPNFFNLPPGILGKRLLWYSGENPPWNKQLGPWNRPAPENFHLPRRVKSCDELPKNNSLTRISPKHHLMEFPKQKAERTLGRFGRDIKTWHLSWRIPGESTSSLRADMVLIGLVEEILHQLIGRLSHFLHGFIHPSWCRISSINSMSSSPTFSRKKVLSMELRAELLWPSAKRAGQWSRKKGLNKTLEKPSWSIHRRICNCHSLTLTQISSQLFNQKILDQYSGIPKL